MENAAEPSAAVVITLNEFCLPAGKLCARVGLGGNAKPAASGEAN